MEELVFCGWPTLVESYLFPKLAGSNYKNYWSHAGQVKRKVDCGKFSLEFNSVKIATHKERLALQRGQINMEKWILPLHLNGVFSKSPVERHAC